MTWDKVGGPDVRYIISGKEERQVEECFLAIGKTNTLRLHWDSTCEEGRPESKKELKLVLEVRAQEFDTTYVFYRTYVTLGKLI